MNKNNKILACISTLFLCMFLFLFFGETNVNASGQSYSPVAYDISQYQGYLTDSQAKNLKKEVKFVILRVQDGSYKDIKFEHNVKLMDRYNIKYGVYGYSEYTNPYQARQEARRLYYSAKGALFYANDFEIGFKNNTDASTSAWANEMRAVNGGKPIVLYGSKSTLDLFKKNTLKIYNNIWLASYSKYMPNPSYKYDLWQYTNAYPSVSLSQKLDGNTIPYGGRINDLLYRKNNKKLNLNLYYHIKNMSYMKVINKKGVNLYINGKVIRRAKYGEVLPIKSFKIKHNRVMAKGNLATYTANKKSVAIYK
ncbi:GH25 family lysozyme [Apilactobacillus micheneri]|uniref:GH25 family lysozyme n=1 Tax=Apilactobacillus micheneri TaxID=1899430 RepID=UPI000D5225A7|nr:GH25 family lysozyme [Apilactobacillus micheneri]GAY79762.1 hypothetical protein NBRC113063_00626 [Apilactobacillus micheneri]